MEEVECYWFFEGQKDEEDSKIKALCLDCHELRQWKNIGWKYRGVTGQWDLNCASCGKNLKTPVEEINN
jgi:hypothetical protein